MNTMRRLFAFLLLTLLVACAAHTSPRVGASSLPIPAPGATGTLLISQGFGSTPIWRVLSGTDLPGGAEYTTAFDCVLTTQSAVSYTTNGNYTLCGQTWVKSNSANETVHAQIIGGQGLNFQPGAVADYPSSTNSGTGTRTLPTMWLAFTSILPSNFDWSTGVRVWAWIEADTITATGYGSAIFGADDDSSGLVNGYGYWRGYGSVKWTAKSLCALYVLGSREGNVNWGCTGSATLSTSNNVMVIDVPHLNGAEVYGSSGTYSSGWPAYNTLNSTSVMSGWTSNTGTGPVLEAPTAMGVFLGAAEAGSGTAVSVTYGRVRVDYRL